MKIFICWIKTLLRTVRSTGLIDGYYVSGHDYVSQDESNTILVCKVCGEKADEE